MPRNGSGTYTLPSGYLATTGQTATAAQHNDPLEDLQSDANAARPVVAGGTGANNASDARDNLGVTIEISNRADGTTQINPDLGTSTKYDGTTLDGRPLTDNESNTLQKGFDVTDHDGGTVTSGTYTPNPADGNSQYIINGGAFTLAPPASSCSMLLLITNNASAGAITTSGFTRVTGDDFTTTNNDRFVCSIARVNGVSVMSVIEA